MYRVCGKRTHVRSGRRPGMTCDARTSASGTEIAQVVEKDPELRGVTEGIALRQDLHVEVGFSHSSNEHKANCENGRVR